MDQKLIHDSAGVVENVHLARDTFRLRMEAPQLAATIRPGQFIMVRVPGRSDPLLGRAFALYDVVNDSAGGPSFVDIVYLVIGKMTGLMSQLSIGDRIEFWGPLGNGFPDYSHVERLVMVAGGIGQTPFLALGKRALGLRGFGGAAPMREVDSVELIYGVRTAALSACVSDFETAGINVIQSSDDGSVGQPGLVTDLLKSKEVGRNEKTQWVGCGPEPMMESLADLASKMGRACDLSLETPMACGAGICFSCVVGVKDRDGWDYRRVCVDGPVFNAAQLVWGAA